jgi:hypothetical protein
VSCGQLRRDADELDPLRCSWCAALLRRLRRQERTGQAAPTLDLFGEPDQP